LKNEAYVNYGRDDCRYVCRSDRVAKRCPEVAGNRTKIWNEDGSQRNSDFAHHRLTSYTRRVESGEFDLDLLPTTTRRPVIR
jgi:hypothetical protein